MSPARTLPLFDTRLDRSDREVRIYCAEHAQRIRVMGFNDHGELVLCSLADLPERSRRWHIDYFASRHVKPALVGPS